MAISRFDILDALSKITEPDRGKDIVRLGLIRNLKTEENKVSFTVMLSAPGSEFAKNVERLCREVIQQEIGPDVEVRIDTDSEMISLGDEFQISGGGQKAPAPPPGVRNFVAVASGKGGVGKSTVAVNLAVALARLGYDVGLVDTDIYGPSIPTMFGIHNERPRVSENRKIIPLEKHGVRLLSMGFLVDPSQATIWRGPMVSSAVRQFLGDTDWGELDYLIMDLPPGTGDIQLTIVQTIPLTGAIIVSTPQDVALADARKGVSMFGNVDVPVFGIIENMSYFSPPDIPDRKYYIFGRGGAQRLAGELGIPFLGEIPIEQIVREGGDEGKPVVVAAPDSLSSRAFDHIARETVKRANLRNAELPPSRPVEILYR